MILTVFNAGWFVMDIGDVCTLLSLAALLAISLYIIFCEWRRNR